MTRCPHFVRTLAILFFAALGVNSAFADSLTGAPVSKRQPVMLTADEMRYDGPTATAIAIGHVEVVQGDTILFADRVTYNQNTDIVHAIGHVSVLTPTGDVVFAQEAELRNDMEKGIVQRFKARLKDNSLFAAREAQKINKNVTKLKDAVYSPCHVCAPGPNEAAKAPLWQMTASQATIDEEAQRVSYRNAFMDVYGIPVLYTPYFSHPTPDAPSQSGLLTPSYYNDSILGNVVKEPVYLSLAPNLDMTLTPWYISNQKPLLEGELRGLTEEGSFYMRGAYTDTYNLNAEGDVIPGEEVRGFIEAHGKLQLSQHWDAGVDAERTTDDTFLALYHFNWQDILTSRLYAERIEDRNYAVVESLAFQGLQLADQSSASPYILPQANLHLESDPLIAHSRLTFDGNALVLERQVGDTDQRLSTQVGWKLPYVTPGGQVFETSATLRADAYNVNNQASDPTTEATFNGDTERFIPEVDMNWRYPFINRFGDSSSLMIAPVVELAGSPNLHQSSRIPNEDSQIAELSDINLFSANRFTGLDQVESGFRGTYGMRGHLEFADQKYLEWLLGQAYQENNDDPFPIANATNAHFSDYIGHVAFKYKWLDVSYSFRVDRDTLTPTSNEVVTGFALKPVNMELTYISLNNEPLYGDRKEIFGNAGLDVTPDWKWNIGGRKDLGSSTEEPVNTSLPISAENPLEPTNGTVGLGTSVVYHNECMMITTALNRSYISVQDVKPTTTFGVTLVLKNFGAANTDTSSNFGNVPGMEKVTDVNTGAAGALNPGSTNNLYGNGSGINAN